MHNNNNNNNKAPGATYETWIFIHAWYQSIYVHIHMLPSTRYKGYVRVRIHVFIPGTRCRYIRTPRGRYTINNWITAKKQLQEDSYDIFIRTWYCTGDPLVRLHTLYSRTYIVRAWNKLVSAWNSSSGLNFPRVFRGHIKTKIHKLKTVLDAGRGWWSA